MKHVIKLTIETNKLWPLYIGGLYVHENMGNFPGAPILPGLILPNQVVFI